MSIYPPTGTLEIKNATLKIPVVDLQYTSNTAKLEANSNVVTEFSRSKKLIKYPRVALTSAAQSSAGGYEGYIVNQSSVFTSESDHGAYLAFRGNSHWLSSLNSFDGAPDRFNDVNGPWISIQLPTKIKLEYLEFSAASNRLAQLITSGSVYASNNGSTWINIGSLDNLGTYTNFVPAHVDFTHTTLYDRYLLHVTVNTTGYNYVHIERLSLFGVPEYDPDAHGTDVTVKSVANVPNTDWLEVYYDGQDYTQPSDFAGPGGVIDKAGGDQNGTAGTGVGFDTTYKAFTFDGSITGNITGTHGLGTGTGITPTISLWFRMNDTATNRFFVIGTQGPTTTSRQSMTVGHHQGFVYLDYWYSEVQTPSTAVVADEWYHLVIVHKGPGTTASGSQDIYLNNVKQILNLHASNNSNDTFDLQGTGLVIGSNPDNTTQLNGSIANFRLFNRALSADEIYQLYAYQKEDFGHSTNNMTLKAGRLGIGTSEPRAALDVRGTINATRFNTLVAEHTVTSTVDSVEINGLDLIGDGGTYKILWKVRNYGATNPQYYMTVNGDATTGNYYYGGKQHTNTQSLHDGNFPTIFRAGQDSTHTLEITMTRSCDGYIVAHGQGTFHTGNNLNAGSVQGWELNRWFYKIPGNVTSILFSSANPDTARYGSGSNIQIHKYM
jgi:hypothetical protein